MTGSRMVSLALTAASLSGLVACSSSSAHPARHAPAASQGAEATPEPASPPGERAPSSLAPSNSPVQSLLDAQIVRVADVLDAGEMAQARLALSRARDSRVQAFAQRMLRQHGDNLQHSDSWQRRAGVTPEESTASAQLQAQTNAALHTLEDLDDARFDASYVRGQVDQHRRALELLDRQLIPNTTHPELKAQLQLKRGVIANHLADAEQLHASL